jgi:hypothetical protein
MRSVRNERNNEKKSFSTVYGINFVFFTSSKNVVL